MTTAIDFDAAWGATSVLGDAWFADWPGDGGSRTRS
jgi:hypothetical protein